MFVPVNANPKHPNSDALETRTRRGGRQALYPQNVARRYTHNNDDDDNDNIADASARCGGVFGVRVGVWRFGVFGTVDGD